MLVGRLGLPTGPTDLRGACSYASHSVALIRFRYVSSRADEDGWKLIKPIFIITRSERSFSWFSMPPEKCNRKFFPSSFSADTTPGREDMVLLTVWSSISLDNPTSMMIAPPLAPENRDTTLLSLS